MDNNKNLSRAIAVILAITILTGIFLVTVEAGRAVTVDGTAVKYNKLQFVYTVSTSGNKTTISWELWCTRTKSGYDTYKKSAPTEVKIDGSTVVSGNKYYDVRDGSKCLCSGTKTITRSNGAAKSVAFSASVDLSGTSVGGKISVSGTIKLPAYETSGKTVTAEIDWIDNNNAAGLRPETVTVVLYKNGTAYKETEVAATGTQVTFKDLPAAYGGTEYVYTVGGAPVENYTPAAPAKGIVKYVYNNVPELGFRIGFSI